MTSLLTRLVRRREARPTLAVTLFTRHECCCCHKAKQVLGRFRRKYRLAIEEVEIDADPALVEAHGLSVPVVAIGGKVRFKGEVNPLLLQRLLDASTRP